MNQDKINTSKIHWFDKKSISIYLLLVYFLFILFNYIRHNSIQIISKDSILLILILWLVVSAFYLIEIAGVREVFKKHSSWINRIALFLSPFLSFLIVEIMVSNYRMEMFRNYSMFNVVWYFIIYLCIHALIRNVKITMIVSNFLIYFASVLNYLVYLFRGNPILPSDLLVWKTGVSVVQNYELNFTKGFIISTFLMLLIYVFASKLENTSVKLTIKNRICGLSAYILFTLLIFHIFFQTDLIKSTIRVLDFFAPKYTYCFYGTAFGFVANVEALDAKSPEGYSVEKVKAAFETIEEEMKTEVTETQETHPNIIAIMNEAYSDLSLIGDYKTNMEYLPYTKTLEENTVKGNLYVSVFGGATSDTEYEFLTGNSMAVMPQNSVPYQQFVTEPTDSLVSTLKSQGYYNIAIHPYEKSGYKRDIVYPLLGFDEFLSKDDFKDPEFVRTFISDRESYKKIIEEYEAKGDDNPLFIFNVTMQNHGGYSGSKLFDDENNVELTEMKGYPEVEQYLSLVRESDKAFQLLVDYFSEQEEPTIILLFGDHQPVAFSGIHSSVEGSDSINQNKYVVPFVMWANYDIEESKIDKMSANYLSSYLLKMAGVRSTEYNHYLLDLYEKLPVINGLFYLDNENRCYGLKEQSEYSDLVNEYQSIGYNNVFDKKNRVDTLYELE